MGRRAARALASLGCPLVVVAGGCQSTRIRWNVRMGFQSLHEHLTELLDTIPVEARRQAQHVPWVILLNYSPLADTCRVPLGKIADCLQRDERVTSFSDQLLVNGSSARGMRVADFHQWLVNRTLEGGPEAAIRELEHLLDGGTRYSFRSIAFVQGINVGEQEWELSDGVVLLPGSVLPDCHLATRGVSDVFLPAMTAGLVIRGVDDVAFISNSREDPSPELLASSERVEGYRRTLDFQRQCLAWASNSGIAPAGHLWEPEESFPLLGSINSAGHEDSWSIMRHSLVQMSTSIQEECNRFSELAKKCFPSNRHLAVSLRHWCRSVLRLDPVERCLELGIAMESLLLGGKNNPQDELRFRIALRLAKLLGRDKSPDQMQVIFKTATDVYKLRSKAIHTGELPATISGYGDGPASIGQCIQYGQGLVRDGLKARMEDPDRDWDELVLGA